MKNFLRKLRKLFSVENMSGCYDIMPVVYTGCLLLAFDGTDRANRESTNLLDVMY